MADTPATATPTTPTTATTTPKRIKVSFTFTKDTDNVVLNRGNAVDKDLDGNVHFPNLPVSLADLRANKATYSDLITASLDGSKKAIAARKKQRHIIIGQLRQLASYVEVALNPKLCTTSVSPSHRPTECPIQLGIGSVSNGRPSMKI